MIGISIFALIVLLVLFLIYRDTTIPSAFTGLIIQIVLLAILHALLRKDSGFAAAIFGLWCLFLLFSGISTAPALGALIDYAFAVLGFVGLAGLVKWRNEQKAMEA